MSLQVWLPLISDLHNQGVSELTFSTISSNTTYNSSGKLGGCYANNSNSSGGLISNTTIDLGQQQSMFCWFKFTSLEESSSLGGGLVSQHRYSTCTGMGITIRYVSSTTGYLSVNTGNGSSRTYNSYYGTTLLQANTWYHGGYTYDGSTIRIYVNGVCEKEQAYSGMSVPADYISIFCWSMANNSGGTTYGDYKFNGSISDARVYSHCLSQKEIKLLSQGLVAHYTLGDRYVAENLIINGFGELGSENWESSSNISTTEIPSGDSRIKASFYNGNRTKDYIPINPTHTYTISGYIKSSGATSGNTYPSIFPYDIDKKFINNYNSTDGFSTTWATTLAQPLKKGDTVVYATDLSSWSTANNNYYYHVAIFGYKDSFGTVYRDFVYTADSPSFGSYSDKSNINKTNNTITLSSPFTGEDRPAGTKICQATEGSTYYYPWGGIALSSISDWTFKTGTFTPYSTGRLKACRYVTWSTYQNCYIAGNLLVDNTDTDRTVYDSSGYNYHGTSSGVSVSSDTPRYSVSTVFDANTDTITPTACFSVGQTMTELSVSCWFRTNTLNSTAPNMWSFGENSFARIRLANSTSIWYYVRVGSTQVSSTYSAGKTLTDNTWHHVVYVFKNGVVRMYLDNVQIGTTDHSSTATYMTCSSTAWHLAGYGANSENFIGSLSDVRIYATALSADDIKELYQTSASIDKSGNMYAYELREV